MLVVRETTLLRGVKFADFAGKPSEAELELYFEATRRQLRESRPEPVVMVVSLREVWPSTLRKKMREFELECVELYKLTQLGMAMVVPNPLIRGAFTAYFWVAPPQYPTRMVASPADAFEFVAECLRAKNMAVPDAEEFRRVANSSWPGYEVRVGEGCVPLRAA